MVLLPSPAGRAAPFHRHRTAPGRRVRRARAGPAGRADARRDVREAGAVHDARAGRCQRPDRAQAGRPVVAAARALERADPGQREADGDRAAPCRNDDDRGRERRRHGCRRSAGRLPDAKRGARPRSAHRAVERRDRHGRRAARRSALALRLLAGREVEARVQRAQRAAARLRDSPLHPLLRAGDPGRRQRRRGRPPAVSARGGEHRPRRHLGADRPRRRGGDPARRGCPRRARSGGDRAAGRSSGGAGGADPLRDPPGLARRRRQYRSRRRTGAGQERQAHLQGRRVDPRARPGPAAAAHGDRPACGRQHRDDHGRRRPARRRHDELRARADARGARRRHGRGARGRPRGGHGLRRQAAQHPSARRRARRSPTRCSSSTRASSPRRRPRRSSLRTATRSPRPSRSPTRSCGPRP